MEEVTQFWREISFFYTYRENGGVVGVIGFLEKKDSGECVRRPEPCLFEGLGAWGVFYVIAGSWERKRKERDVGAENERFLERWFWAPRRGLGSLRK